MATLTISQATQRRDELLTLFFEKDIPNVAGFVQGKKDQINIARMQNRIKELQETNAAIEQKKTQALSKKTCCCLDPRQVKVTTWIILGLNIIAWIAIGGISINDLVKDTAPKPTTIANLAVTIVALFITSVVITIIKDIQTDLHNFAVIAAISQVKEQGETQYRDFLKALEDFKNNQKKDDLSLCIQQFDRLPSNQASKIPKEFIMPRLVAMMPDDDEFKIKFNTLNKLALLIYESEKKEGNLLNSKKKSSSSTCVSTYSTASDNSSSDEKSFVKEKPDTKINLAAFKTSSVSTLSPKTDRKPTEDISQKRTFEKIKDDDSSSSSHGSEDDEGKFEAESAAPQQFLPRNSLSLPPHGRISPKEAKSKFERTWKELEKDIGIEMNFMKLENAYFDRKAHVADEVSLLPGYSNEAPAV